MSATLTMRHSRGRSGSVLILDGQLALQTAHEETRCEDSEEAHARRAASCALPCRPTCQHLTRPGAYAKVAHAHRPQGASPVLRRAPPTGEVAPSSTACAGAGRAAGSLDDDTVSDPTTQVQVLLVAPFLFRCLL